MFIILIRYTGTLRYCSFIFFSKKINSFRVLYLSDTFCSCHPLVLVFPVIGLAVN